MLQPAVLPNHRIDSILGSLVLLTLTAALAFPLSLSFFPHLMGVIGCCLLFLRNKTISRPDRTIVIALLSIPAFILLSIIWAIEPDKIGLKIFKISTGLILFIPFILLIRDIPAQSAIFIRKYFSVPFFICGAFIVSELVFNFPVLSLIKQRSLEAWELNKNIASYILLVPFAVAFLLRDHHKALAGLLIALCTAVLLTTDSQAAQLAGLVSVGVVIGYKVIPKFMLKLSFAVAIIALFSMPWISTAAYDFMADKVGDEGILRQACASQRLEIWDFVSQKIMESPWVGFGMESSRHMTFDSRMVYFKEQHILHPHNISLQIWIEFGAAGFIFVCGLLALLYKAFAKQSYQNQVLPVICFSAAFIVLMVSWSMWSSWLIGLLLLLVSFYNMIVPPSGFQYATHSDDAK